jgi:hypothetical protein
LKNSGDFRPVANFAVSDVAAAPNLTTQFAASEFFWYYTLRLSITA